MKRIVTALGNSVLNTELRKYIKYDVIQDDIFYQEGVIDFASKNEFDVIILSGVLQGQLGISDFVSQIHNANMTARIIVIVDSISEEDRNFLISKGVFDILYDDQSDVQDVIDAIDREEPINIRAQVQSEVKQIKEELEKNAQNQNVTDITEYIAMVQKQQVISIFGTNGSGKSSVSANMCKAFSKMTKSKILLIDMDTMNGNLDELLDVPKVTSRVELIMDEDKKCGLNYAADLSIKNRLDTNVLDEIVIECQGFDFLSGNTSLHYCQNVLNEDFYDYLLKCAKEKYDFIFLDLSSNLFLDSTKWALKESTKVMFVTEATNICLKKTLQILDTVFNVWNVYKQKFSIILNRSLDELDKDVFKELTKLDVIGQIKNGQIKNDESYLKILESIEYVPKKNFFLRVKENSKLLTSIIAGIHS
jgi:MinD-like ATPase involved in chromosome partitioning or flagellar assembly